MKAIGALKRGQPYMLAMGIIRNRRARFALDQQIGVLKNTGCRSFQNHRRCVTSDAGVGSGGLKLIP